MGSRFVLVLLALFLAAPASAGAARMKLFHDSFDPKYRTPFGAVPAGSKVTLRLRVTGGKPTSVSVHFGARFVALRRSGTMWSATVATPSTPSIVRYDFRVRAGRRTLWYGDDGDADILSGGTGITSSFEQGQYTITAYAPSFTTPAWERGGVVYSLFPDRFRNGDPSNDYCRAGSTTGCPTFFEGRSAMGHPTWNERVFAPPPFNLDFFGGDLQGVEQKLDYLKSLGVDAIWLNPIFKASSNHRYDTVDYMHVDPALGGDAAFASLVSAAKTRGIRLILDGVFNHASADSIYFDRFHRNASVGACESTSSPYRSWFKISGGTPCGEQDYVFWAGVPEMPVFQHDNSGVKEFFFGGPDAVAKHWLAAGASGWRLDAAQEIDHPWWREFRTAVKAVAPDAPLIAEDTAGPTDATDFLLGNEVDGVMNYNFREDATAFTRPAGPLPPSKLGHALTAMWERYPKQAVAASFDLIDSHDTPRALNSLVGPGESGLATARQRLMLTALLQYTWVGAPMVLYGDEVGINAPGSDPFNRAPYPWPDASGDLSLYGPPDLGMLDFYTRLGRLRADLPALRDGGFASLFAGDTSKASGDNDVYAFLRSGGAAKPVIVVLNKGAGAETATIPVRGAFPNGTALQDALGGGGGTVSGGVVKVTVPARRGLVLVAG